MKSHYKQWPHTREALAQWRVLAVNEKERQQLDQAEASFNEEDAAQNSVRRFMRWVNDQAVHVQIHLEKLGKKK